MNLTQIQEKLEAEIVQLRIQLEEATETIQAIRTGQIDALIVEGIQGHQLYTLKTADQTYRVFIETMHEGAVTLNKQGLILYCNSNFAAMVNKPLSTVIGTAFSSYLAPLDQLPYQSFFQQSWLVPQKAELVLGQLESALICLFSATPLNLDEGPCLSLILTDLTLQKQTQALLKQSNQELAELNATLAITNQALNRSNDNLQQFAFVASHDLQEPLRKVMQFGDLLKNSYAGQLGDGLLYVERMQSAASRMSVLIRDLLSFSRISSLPAARQHIALEEVIESALTDLELRIQESQARVEVGPLPTVVGDRSQLGQLFQNLLSNALKFSQPAGAHEVPLVRVQSKQLLATNLPVDVTPVRTAQAYYQITVSDNGVGFDEKYLDRIFQVFQRLHGTNEFAGTGIGLAICEKVVTNHGGAITASSQPGQGATFHIYLPI